MKWSIPLSIGSLAGLALLACDNVASDSTASIMDTVASEQEVVARGKLNEHLHCRNYATRSVFNMTLTMGRENRSTGRATFLLNSDILRTILASQGTTAFRVTGSGNFWWENDSFRFEATLPRENNTFTVAQGPDGVLLSYLGLGNGTPSIFLFKPNECWIGETPL